MTFNNHKMRGRWKPQPPPNKPDDGVTQGIIFIISVALTLLALVLVPYYITVIF